MSVTTVEQSPMAPFQPVSAHAAVMSRPQVGIERLPTRRLSNEPRESMNCKSCRKRKIKCNRMRPSCEACLVFQCACIYDAVPKKRGPKTDVLEALLKRVDGLEQKLKDQKKDDRQNAETSGDGSNAGGSASGGGLGAGSGSGAESGVAGGRGGETSPGSDSSAGAATSTSMPGEQPPTLPNMGSTAANVPLTERPRKQPKPAAHDRLVTTTLANTEPSLFSSQQQPPTEQPPAVPIDALLHTYFTRSHAKPFHILDESTFRQRLQLNQIPSYLLGSVCALASRYTPHPDGYHAAVQLGEEYALRARAEVDSDEPSIDCLQTLLLLSLAFVASGKGKKAYMLLSNAIGMAVALELHREMDANVRVSPVEREMRRRLFWTCYLLDRFMACGSRRPSLINDSTVLLRLPSWLSTSASMVVEGEFFQTAANLQYLQGGGGKKLQGGNGMLVDISRILGTTNRYLAAGGVKGDSHFPWHSLSNLSKIRQDLDAWASGAQDILSSVEALFSQPDSTVLVMSKLIYHLIHCLIYRPFLPVDLAELSGTGQHQSWQIEATNMCFLHANAIAELTELGKQMPQVEWPGFVGYCICTAGTVHIHGAHYNKNAAGGAMSVFAASAEFLSREMQHLTEMRHAWACVQHHRQTLQSIYSAHAELVKSVANSPLRYSPVFQLEDFFDRYSNIGGPGGLSFNLNASNLILDDVVVDFAPDPYMERRLCKTDLGLGSGAGFDGSGTLNGNAAGKNAMDVVVPERPALKRKKTVSSLVLPAGEGSGGNSSNMDMGMASAGSSLQTPFSTGPFSAHTTTSTLLASPTAMSPPLARPGAGVLGDRMLGNDAPGPIADVAGFSLGSHLGLPPQVQVQQKQSSMASAAPFSPAFAFSSMGGGSGGGGGGGNSNSNSNNGNNGNSNTGNQVALSGYDPMFATMTANAFSSPSPWPVDDAGSGGGGGGGVAGKPGGTGGGGGGVFHHSPDGCSNDGSAGGTVVSEEKDPFLSLLEQLAENEYVRGPGNELDFFLGGTSESV